MGETWTVETGNLVGFTSDLCLSRLSRVTALGVLDSIAEEYPEPDARLDWRNAKGCVWDTHAPLRTKLAYVMARRDDAPIYSVGVGLPGYLYADGWPVWCETIGYAIAIARDERDAFRDAGYRVVGNIARDWVYIVRHESGAPGARDGWSDWQRIEINQASVQTSELAEYAYCQEGM